MEPVLEVGGNAQQVCLTIEGREEEGGEEEGVQDGERNIEAEERGAPNLEVVKNLSENPETGQSELIGEEVLPEVTSSHDDEGREEEGTRAEGEEDPVSSTLQLEEVHELLEVICLCECIVRVLCSSLIEC